MDTSETNKINLGSPTQDVDKSLDDELQHLLQTLPKEEGQISPSGSVYLYQGFWCSARGLRSVISLSRHFQAFDSDVTVATFSKCGTTWLKALTFYTCTALV
ncbi:sulfotransferase 2A, ARABIDOPSIS THALIANA SULFOTRANSFERASE 2A [Hibiscus trionum]|uniref:Sulfotransferase 2A, ARABIDOPSIS THALIANA SULFOTRANSFERASE 2A n=1 Tax=Hibiscus trionum TaxID=183268 RepID=A0A9W7MJ34_HIBTR|nr:sulfotransferase 2A, ARABIDOPSIS THALIANA SULFOTRANSFERASE 2A [Hibiscus trionum]